LPNYHRLDSLLSWTTCDNTPQDKQH
jgi:hypothetical protein